MPIELPWVVTFNGDDIFLCYIKRSEVCSLPPQKKSIRGRKKSLVFVGISDVFEKMSEVFARMSEVFAEMSDVLRETF